MKTKYVKVAAFLGALVFVVALCSRPSILAQAQDKMASSGVSTNWVGGLVIGKREAGDPIAGRRLFPQADDEIEIGLRSDGVIVWRKARP